MLPPLPAAAVLQRQRRRRFFFSCPYSNSKLKTPPLPLSCPLFSVLFSSSSSPKKQGCYDAATLAGLQAAVRGSSSSSTPSSSGPDAAFARGNAEACLSMPIPAELDALLACETRKADKEALARLMADHTQGDWRPVVRNLRKQEALVVAGGESRIFPVEGCDWVAKNAPKSKCVVFKGCGHWLYLERAEEFAELVAGFAVGGLERVDGAGVV